MNRTLFMFATALALAAFALLPMTAEATSQGQVYTPEVPSVETEAPEAGGKPKGSKDGSDGSRTTTEDGGAPVTGGETTTEPESESKEGHRRKSNQQGEGGGHGGGDGPQEGATTKDPQSPESDVRKPKDSPGTDTGGGSSPVVPILIALVVLATISVGVVIYRERRPAG